MWARIISLVFHPLFIPTYFFAFLAWAVPAMLEPVAPQQQQKFLFFFFLVTCILPLMNVGLFKMFGGVRALSMPTRRERLLPFVTVAVIFIAVTYMFHLRARMNLNDNFLKFMVVFDLLVVVAAVATFFFKVSVHSIAVWGLIGILIPLNKIIEVNTIFYPTIGVIVLAGLVMAARLRLGAHSSREVMWGAVLGLGTGLVGMLTLF